MPTKVTCANCDSIVDFVAYDLVKDDENQLNNVVPVNDNGEYLCGDCMEFARKNPGELKVNFAPSREYVAAHIIAQMSGMLIMADDLLMQVVNDRADFDYHKFVAAHADWINKYKAFRKQNSGEDENVH